MRPARQKSTHPALGGSRGGQSTKIHAVVEGLGSLARFCLTGGEVGDSPEALPLLRGLKPGSVSADKAYGSDAILDYLKASTIEAVISPRSTHCIQREFDRHRYKSRNFVERFFCRIKQFRRVATRYYKLAQRFLSFVAFAAGLVWLA
jgi:transposase